jgi:hypothetical protein
MKKNKLLPSILLAFIAGCIILFTSCTKYGKGFLSPYVQYASSFTFAQGSIASSYSLTSDGSSIPMHIKWVHIYDANGNMVDSLFSKTYQVGIWTAAYNPKTDTTYALIMAKRGSANLTPIVVNETSGTIQSTTASLYVPIGTYTMDLEVSNTAGTETLKKLMTFVITKAVAIQVDDPATGIGAFSNSALVAGGAAGAVVNPSKSTVFFNGVYNPFDVVTVTRFADTPNTFILKITDRNGMPFSFLKGEIAKRPAAGLNPNPPFLQNLQDYSPDTYKATDTAATIRYALAPFPIISLGNGFNMYYDIHAAALGVIDSTSAWTSNTLGNYYKGPSDSHYLGTITPGRIDYAIRTPVRILVPGAYQITVKVLNVTHK